MPEPMDIDYEPEFEDRGPDEVPKYETCMMGQKTSSTAKSSSPGVTYPTKAQMMNFGMIRD